MSVIGEFLFGFFVPFGRRPALVVPVHGRSDAVLLFEKLDVVGGIGELAFRSDVGDGFVGRYEQQAGVGQPSFEKPFVGRFVEMLDEFLLERGQALMA